MRCLQPGGKEKNRIAASVGMVMEELLLIVFYISCYYAVSQGLGTTKFTNLIGGNPSRSPI